KWPSWRLGGRQSSRRRIVGGSIGGYDQRVGVFELVEQTGGQGSHIVAADMNTANHMKMAIAGKGDIDGRPGGMITAQRGPKRFYPVQQIHTTSLCEISC